MRNYKNLETQLIHMRWVHQGRECEEEEALLETMSEAWLDMSAEDQRRIRAEGPKTLLDEQSPFALREWRDDDPASGTTGYRILFERA